MFPNYFNNYNNTPVNQSYGYTPNYAPYTQPPIPTQQSTNTNKIFVNGIEDVRNRRLAPDSDFMFLDNDRPLLYQKTVDGKGQFEVKVFDIVPHKEEAVPVNNPDYVLRSDFEKLSSEFTELKNKILGGTNNESVKQQQSSESNDAIS